MKRYLFVILLLFSSSANTFAAGVKLLCRPTPDSIMLRWAPTNKQVWNLGNKYGYMVERYTILRNGQLLQDFERNTLTPTPLRPQPLSVWELLSDDRFAAIAAECIYGGNVGTTLASPTAIGKRFREEQNRFSFALYAADQSPLVARLSGLSFTDKNATPHEKYFYRVFIAQPDSFPTLDTAAAFTGISEYQPLPEPQEFKAQWGDKKALLSWNTQYLNHIYNSYVVEKSTDSVTFTPLSNSATVQLSSEATSPRYAYKTDSLPNNQTKYYYRLRGINAFGELGPPCKAVSGQGRLPLTQSPILVSSEAVNNSQVNLTWDYPTEMNPYIKGFGVYRASSPNGLRQLIHTAQGRERSYTDSTPLSGNYYSISVFDHEQELISPQVLYAELVDSVPPSAPVGLQGNIDSVGMVYLTWKNNAEQDFDGYRVYRANRPDGEFALISPDVVHDTTFIDKVNIQTLTCYIYYRLKAVDMRQNQSRYSTTLELTRPDIIPPVAPRLLGVEAQKQALVISWVNSSSDDVARHHLYRKGNADTAFTLIASVEKSGNQAPTTYDDKSIIQGTVYQYYVIAEDKAGLRSSQSQHMSGKIENSTTENIRLKLLPYSGTAKLQWVVQSSKKVTRVIVYRSVGGAPLQTYGNTTEGSFTDSNLSLESKYTYAVKAVYDDETMSPLSNQVTMER